MLVGRTRIQRRQPARGTGSDLPKRTLTYFHPSPRNNLNGNPRDTGKTSENRGENGRNPHMRRRRMWGMESRSRWSFEDVTAISHFSFPISHFPFLIFHFSFFILDTPRVSAFRQTPPSTRLGNRGQSCLSTDRRAPTSRASPQTTQHIRVVGLSNCRTIYAHRSRGRPRNLPASAPQVWRLFYLAGAEIAFCYLLMIL